MPSVGLWSTHYFIHYNIYNIYIYIYIYKGGLAGGPTFLKGLEVQPVDEICGAGNLSLTKKIMENSSHRVALDSFN